MPTIDHELRIAVPAEKVFTALTTLDGVKGWHTPAAEGSGEVGSTWVFGFADHPEFAWEVVASDAPTETSPSRRSPRHVVWRCVRGPGDSVGTTATFTLSDLDDGRTLLEHVHAGWPGTHGNFRKCNTTWGVLLHHLRDYAETGIPAPAFE